MSLNHTRRLRFWTRKARPLTPEELELLTNCMYRSRVSRIKYITLDRQRVPAYYLMTGQS